MIFSRRNISRRGQARYLWSTCAESNVLPFCFEYSRSCVRRATSVSFATWPGSFFSFDTSNVFQWLPSSHAQVRISPYQYHLGPSQLVHQSPNASSSSMILCPAILFPLTHGRLRLVGILRIIIHLAIRMDSDGSTIASLIASAECMAALPQGHSYSLRLDCKALRDTNTKLKLPWEH